MSIVHKTSRLNWFNNALTTLFGNRRGTQRRRSRSRSLGMESLEQRVVLSVDFVSGFAMGVDQKGPVIVDNAVDSAGNTYIAGTFSGTVDFDQATVRPDGSDLMISSGTIDGFVAKYAPDNSLVWAQKMGGAAIWDYGLQYDKATDLEVDNNGNVYVAGNYLGTSTFGQFTVSPIFSNSVYQDTFVAKLNANGDFQWVRTAGYSGQDDVGDVTVDASGNVVMAIYSGFGMDVKKYNSGGTLQWTNSISTGFANPWGVVARSIDVDGSGNVIVSGDFAGTVDFNADRKKTFNVTGAPAPSGTSGTSGTARCVNAYVLKLSAAGTFSWVAPFIAKTTENSGSFVDGTNVDVSPTGELFVSGAYCGAVDINPSSTVDQRLNASFVRPSAFVAKLSSAGSLIWARSIGSDGYVYPNDMQSDSAGVYIVGIFRGTLDTGNSAMPLTTGGDSDGFVIHMSNSGVTDWTYAVGGSGHDYINGIDIAPDGTLALAGSYSSPSLDFDKDGAPDLLGRTTGTNNAPRFLVKLRRR